MALFKFNSGEIKDLYKPLAFQLQSRGQGVIMEDKEEIKKTPENKIHKEVKRRKTK
jgi:hypothetical protein